MDAKSGRPTRYSTIVSVNCYVNSADGEIRFPFLFFFFLSSINLFVDLELWRSVPASQWRGTRDLTFHRSMCCLFP